MSCFTLQAGEEWVSAADREIRVIENHPKTIVVDGLSLTDRSDGLSRWGTGGSIIQDVAPEKIFRLGGDRHTLAFGRVDGLVIKNCQLTADQVEEALKFSACRNVVVENCIITGGTEDAVDIVRGENFYFRGVTFVARGEYALTIKCGVQHVRFIDCRFTGVPSSGVFIDLGNWGDYDVLKRDPTGDVAISTSCVFETGGGKNGVPVRTLYAEKPQFAGEVYDVPDVLVRLFFGFRRWQVGDAPLKKYGLKELMWVPSGELGFTPERRGISQPQ